MWSVTHLLLRWCGVAVLLSGLRCCGRCCGVATLRSVLSYCIGIAIYVAALRSILQLVLQRCSRCCGIVVMVAMWSQLVMRYSGRWRERCRCLDIKLPSSWWWSGGEIGGPVDRLICGLIGGPVGSPRWGVQSVVRSGVRSLAIEFRSAVRSRRVIIDVVVA